MLRCALVWLRCCRLWWSGIVARSWPSLRYVKSLRRRLFLAVCVCGCGCGCVCVCVWTSYPLVVRAAISCQFLAARVEPTQEILHVTWRKDSSVSVSKVEGKGVLGGTARSEGNVVREMRIREREEGWLWQIPCAQRVRAHLCVGVSVCVVCVCFVFLLFGENPLIPMSNSVNPTPCPLLAHRPYDGITTSAVGCVRGVVMATVNTCAKTPRKGVHIPPAGTPQPRRRSE